MREEAAEFRTRHDTANDHIIRPEKLADRNSAVTRQFTTLTSLKFTDDGLEASALNLKNSRFPGQAT